MKKKSVLTGIIFSKDRPLQLDATLRSYFLNCQDTDIVSLRVLYITSSPYQQELYENLMKEHPTVEFIHENIFKNDLLKIISEYAYVLFLVDDAIFVREFQVTNILNVLDNDPDAIGFSLRLGKNTVYCYPLDKEQKLPQFQSVDKNILKYDWRNAEYDFGYSLEISSSIYRVNDIWNILSNLHYKSPNTLEEIMSLHKNLFNETKPMLLCFNTSIVFCNPINKVQSELPSNRSGTNTNYSTFILASLYGEGSRIDVEHFSGYTPRSCHEEVKLKIIVKPDDQKGVNNPLISVIIPCYNYAHYLPEAIESVVNQTYKNFEIIIVNDGSTDNTKEVAEDLIRKFSDYKIKLRNQINSGRPAISRNNGIKESSGEYILSLDADDKIDTRMLMECCTELQRGSPNRIIYTARQDFDGNDSIVMPSDYNFEKLKYENQMSYCALFPKKMWQDIGGYRTNTGMEDWDFWIAAGLKGYIGTLIPKPLFFYRRHDIGQFQKDVKNIQLILATIIINNEQAYDKKECELARQYLSIVTATVVSVIIPTFNRTDKLKDAIVSVLKQSYKNFEIVVVNDAGKDVKNIIDSFNDPRIKYFQHGSNRGLPATRNTGIRNSNGKYIAYLDDDDTYYPNHLEVLLKNLESDSEYKVAYTDSLRATYKKRDENYYLEKKELIYSEDFDYEKIFWGNFIPVLCIMHEKSCVESVGLFDETLTTHEDWDLWIRISREFKFKHIKTVTSEFRWVEDGSSMTSSKQGDFLNTTKIIYKKYENLTKDNKKILEAQKNTILWRESMNVQSKEIFTAKQAGGNIKIDNLLTKIPILTKQNNFFDAYLLTQKILAYDPFNKEAKNYFEQLVNMFAERKKNIGWNQQKMTKTLAEAETLINNNKLFEAKEKLETILNIEPQYIEALNDFSVVNILENNLESAGDLINSILKIDPNNEVARSNYQYLSNLMLKPKLKKNSNSDRLQRPYGKNECPCCYSFNIKKYRNVEGYQYYKCSDCGVLFIAAEYLENIDEGLNLVEYTGEYWNKEILPAKERSAGIAIARMAEVCYYSRIPIHKFIDIGSGTGFFLDAVKMYLPNSADIFYAIEKYPPKPEHRSKSQNYLIGELDEVNIKFDAGMCIEVIEHLTPKMLADLFYRLAKISNSQASYIINTGMPEYVEREDESYLDPKMRGHIISYSIEAVRAIVEEIGFSVFPIKGKTWAFLVEYQSKSNMRENVQNRIWSALDHNLKILTDKDMGSVIKILGLETSRAYN